MSTTDQASPLVFLHYTQEELDRAYDQRVWAANADEVVERYTQGSEAARARIAHRADLCYGRAEDEVLDLFPALSPLVSGAGAPIHVHIHGGAWRYFGKSDASYPAPAFVAAGVHYIAPHFSNLPDVRLPEMVEQLRRALAWIHANAASFGGDPGRIHLSGHSSGAHLAAVLLTTDWAARGLPASLIGGGLLVSGIYDLEPVLLSARRGYVELDADEARRLSPLHHAGNLRCPVIVAYGERESPEFKRQARAFEQALRNSGGKVELLADDTSNHFEIIESLARPDGLLARAALRQILPLEE